MAKKIVFVGPSGIGKSTLRKIIFEGESIFKLLENPLEPTYGYENYSYQLLQEVGIFDLAGQETERWFDEEARIFADSDVIINVLDSRTAPRIIIEYIEKAYQIQHENSEFAKIFFLIHKIDLVDEFIVDRIDKRLQMFAKTSQLPDNAWFFTSIKPNHIISTVDAFVSIFKECDLEKETELNLNLINTNAKLFEILKNQKVMSLSRLTNLLGVSSNFMEKLVKDYEKALIIELKKKDDSVLVFLTEKGENYYDQVVQSLMATEEKVVEQKTDYTQLYGILISDTNGKTLLTIEMSDGSLINALNRTDNPQFDIELIPMFINALQKFSEEINVQNLSGFRVQGGNLKISSISHKDHTMTLFGHPDLRIDLIKEDFNDLFFNFLGKYEDYLPKFDKTGNATPFLEYKPKMLEQIQKILEKYTKIKVELDRFNIEDAKKLYAQMNAINEDELPIQDQIKIKSLKVKMLESILAEDIVAFKNIEKDVTQYVKMPYLQ